MFLFLVCILYHNKAVDLLILLFMFLFFEGCRGHLLDMSIFWHNKPVDLLMSICCFFCLYLVSQQGCRSSNPALKVFFGNTKL